MHNNRRNNKGLARGRWTNRAHRDDLQNNNINQEPEMSKNVTHQGANGVAKVRAVEKLRPIRFKTLEKIFKDEEDSALILKLSADKCGFFQLLQQNGIRPDFMCLILDVLEKISNCATDQDTTQLLVFFFMKIIPKSKDNTNFHKELKCFIADLPNKLSVLYHDREKYTLAVQNLLKFLRKLQLTMYQNSYELVSNLVPNLTALIEYINRKGNCLNDTIVDLLVDLNNGIEHYEQMKKKTEKSEVLYETPDDFRMISIYPDGFDIQLNHEPFLRPNIVNGNYVGGVDHYLDVQFRLLREDFVRPLREGISEYIRIQKAGNNANNLIKNKVKDLNVYKEVHIVSSKMINNDQVQECEFNCKPFQNIRWQVKI